jgi:hypothetical protein
VLSPVAHRLLFLFLLLPTTLLAQSQISGTVLDPFGIPVPNAHLKLQSDASSSIADTLSNSQGLFTFSSLPPGNYRLTADSASFTPITLTVSLALTEQKSLTLQFTQLAAVLQSITVVASSPSSLTPDPSQTVVVHDQVLDANPGRPGAPISIPGLPIETASGGIKAPQYFAPGVAGDHGEPIAQFFQVGNFLFPNNLPANAHGNGYSDPNFLIPATIDAVTVDGGAFNVREGNHSVDLATTYIPRQRLHDFLQITGDDRDIDLVAGWSPQNPSTNAWLGAEASYGNGFLDRLEHRQQYKLNGYRQFKWGSHELTLLGLAYYGFSFVPGLTPIQVHVPNDTIDNRQLDRTNNFLAAANDIWHFTNKSQFNFAAFFRDYSLTLRSNFGDGLIQQSETRTVVGGESSYLQTIRPWLSILAGIDLRRDAPRNLDLDRATIPYATGPAVFQPLAANNLTLSFVAPFLSADGALGQYIHYDVGLRQEEVWMNNQDLLIPANSFDKLASLSLPKATLTFFPGAPDFAPTISLSYGEAFHTEDPRIGSGPSTGPPSLLSPSRAYQLRFSKTIHQFETSLTLRRTSNSQELGKIDPDTGLQEDFGPSVNHVIVVSVQRTFSHSAFYISYAQADARDTLTGAPTPEAPRLIWDAVASENRLAFGLQARGEFEFVRAKPVGDGLISVPVYETRGAVIRPFAENKMSFGLNFLIAKGYTGQTTETLPTQPAPCPVECVVGVPLKSYVALTYTYFFSH